MGIAERARRARRRARARSPPVKTSSARSESSAVIARAQTRGRTDPFRARFIRFKRFKGFKAFRGFRGSGTSGAFRALDSYKYVGFESVSRLARRGQARLESYLPFFAGAADVLDIGCGAR